jgi:tripartite-type tricarboxylate transporter receptor subunit TctC
MEMRQMRPFLLACLASAALLAGTAVQAQPVGDFYRGKVVHVLIGVGVGGEYDIQARLTAKYIGRHIPGAPTVVPENMVGAGGLKMANYLYEVAPRDGTYIGMIANSFPAIQAVGGQGVQFDANAFQWIGSIAATIETMAVWHTTGVISIEQARQKEVVAGASGRGAITYTFPAVMNELLGTKFKIITGYAGGNDINLAMERGEVGARNNTWSSWKATKPDWLRDKLITVIAQAGPPATDLKAPSVLDLAKSDEERQLIALIVSGTLMGRPLATTPGTPPERVAALRAAFDATMQDPDFRAETTTAGFEIDPVSGLALQKVVADVLKTPKPIAMRAKQFLE